LKRSRGGRKCGGVSKEFVRSWEKKDRNRRFHLRFAISKDEAFHFVGFAFRKEKKEKLSEQSRDLLEDRSVL